MWFQSSCFYRFLLCVPLKYHKEPVTDLSHSRLGKLRYSSTNSIPCWSKISTESHRSPALLGGSTGRLSKMPWCWSKPLGRETERLVDLGRKLSVCNSNCPLELQENSEVSHEFWGRASTMPQQCTRQTNAGSMCFKMLLEERLANTQGVSEWSPDQQHQHHLGAC